MRAQLSSERGARKFPLAIVAAFFRLRIFTFTSSAERLPWPSFLRMNLYPAYCVEAPSLAPPSHSSYPSSSAEISSSVHFSLCFLPDSSLRPMPLTRARRARVRTIFWRRCSLAASLNLPSSWMYFFLCRASEGGGGRIFSDTWLTSSSSFKPKSAMGGSSSWPRGPSVTRPPRFSSKVVISCRSTGTAPCVWFWMIFFSMLTVATFGQCRMASPPMSRPKQNTPILSSSSIPQSGTTTSFAFFSRGGCSMPASRKGAILAWGTDPSASSWPSPRLHRTLYTRSFSSKPSTVHFTSSSLPLTEGKMAAASSLGMRSHAPSRSAGATSISSTARPIMLSSVPSFHSTEARSVSSSTSCTHPK
mmetsp:Transcript_32874/g.92054  ORF Transcript_32874/g.92054 Transcript_32874/m.92054 type:complete len:361 (-) Transcript_32874:279-1361(-)